MGGRVISDREHITMTLNHPVGSDCQFRFGDGRYETTFFNGTNSVPVRGIVDNDATQFTVTHVNGERLRRHIAVPLRTDWAGYFVLATNDFAQAVLGPAAPRYSTPEWLTTNVTPVSAQAIATAGEGVAPTTSYASRGQRRLRVVQTEDVFSAAHPFADLHRTSWIRVNVRDAEHGNAAHVRPAIHVCVTGSRVDPATGVCDTGEFRPSHIVFRTANGSLRHVALNDRERRMLTFTPNESGELEMWGTFYQNVGNTVQAILNNPGRFEGGRGRASIRNQLVRADTPEVPGLPSGISLSGDNVVLPEVAPSTPVVASSPNPRKPGKLLT